MQSPNFNLNLNIRRHYNKIESVKDIPDLIEMQKNSYYKFLQVGVVPKDREDVGLQSALSAVFPMSSVDGKCMLELVEYNLLEPECDIVESKRRGINYAAPLKLRLRLTTNDINKEIGVVTVKDIQEKEVYLCDLPLMTENGSFIINGTERVIVSQIYRSPGIFFDHDKGKNTYDKLLYSASIIPHVGSWLDIEFDSKDLLHVRIDKRKKISLSALLKALDSNSTEELKKKAEKESKVLDPDLIKGMDNDEILSTFYESVSVEKLDHSYKIDFVSDFYKGRKLSFDLKNAENNEILVKAGTTISTIVLRKLAKQNITSVFIDSVDLLGRYLGNTIYNSKTKDVLLYSGTEITEDVLEILHSNSINKFKVLLIDNINIGPYILNTLLADKIDSREKALNEIYSIVKSSDAPSLEAAQELFHNLFFNVSRYNLSEVGRVKINERLNDYESSSLVLEKRDIISIIRVLLQIRDGHSKVDDIDHLGNRRVRSVGELVENEIRVALVRMERYVQEKMNAAIDVSVNDLINVKAVQAALREFFGSSQLSQFMDQTNPLSEITHKRRLSALGPKGLARDRASFEVRDVHTTHYGRICPIETPEGPNIGLINSLAIFARVNKYGFLETPYRKVVDGVVTNEVEYMNASREGNYSIAQSTVALDSNNRFVDNLISCRVAGDLVLLSPEDVQYIDVSPKQLVSVAASLVPFLENDDANRALMGANMQRQAVPLLKNEAPIVGTGMEKTVAHNSGAVIVAKRSGVVQKVDSLRIIILADTQEGDESLLDIYNLKKFQRSNHNTCINQSPIVNVGDRVKAGDIITNGNSIDAGELALGKNVLVGFVPWNGYNFEDAILISERVVTDDVFTSIHIEELEIVARDTKLGAEEITSDIPNIGDEALKNLDESGIVYVGADVKPGDILVGKTTPKAESVVTSEEKLLRAIFGEKSVDVRDTSLKVPAGITGTVIDVRVFSRRGLTKDARTQTIERSQVTALSKEREEEYQILALGYAVKARTLLENNEVLSSKKLAKGTILTSSMLQDLNLSELLEIKVSDAATNTTLSDLLKQFDNQILKLNARFESKKLQMQKGDDLQTGVLKVVKVFIAVKRKLQPGDKMAGRHGNKGVVSKILPIEDMPHLEDGTPVDICLNPLGVPSRMNVGQVLEVHTGWACRNIGKQVENMLEEYYLNKENLPDIKDYLLSCYGNHEKDKIMNLSDEEIIVVAKNIRKGMPVATPVFDGVREKDINELLEFCNLDESAQVTLIDGRTGEPFERKVTVGYIYMLKLHHLVDDKIHARSIGPYSLITQQPLGGKAQFGGQRFGEMEVWALESYGAAHILQEMLTVKSDDQQGRVHVYEAIVKGEESFTTGIPESFNVLMKELRSLALNLEMKKKENN